MENKRLIISVGAPIVGDNVESVNGQTGVVVLDSTDIETVEGSGITIKQSLDGKEDSITAGTTSQYFRGDKTFQTLDKSAVGLGNVDNTSDVDKPISTATQSALDDKVAIATNPSKTVKGSIKAFYDATTSTLEISIDGTDIT